MPRPNILNPDREIFTLYYFAGPCALAQLSWSENFSRKGRSGRPCGVNPPRRFMHAVFLRGPKHQGLVWACAHSVARNEHREAFLIYALSWPVRIAVRESVRCLVPTMATLWRMISPPRPAQKAPTDPYHVAQSWIFLAFKLTFCFWRKFHLVH